MTTMNLLKLLLRKIKSYLKQNIYYFSQDLLEGNYPDTSRLIPNESKTDIVLHTKEFLHAIDRASLLAEKEEIMLLN